MHLLQVLSRGIEYFCLIPCTGQLRQGDHFQILIGGGIREYLQILNFDLLITPQTGIEIDSRKGCFRAVGGQ